MVYAALTFTPMHDLMITIALAFFTMAMLAVLWVLFVQRRVGVLVAGAACAVPLVLTAVIYYSGQYIVLLPWAQRISLGISAGWLLTVDLGGASRRAGA